MNFFTSKKVLFRKQLRMRNLFLLLGAAAGLCGCVSHKDHYVLSSPGEAQKVQGIYPGQPANYYATTEEGHTVIAYPSVMTPDRGEMMDIPATIAFVEGSARLSLPNGELEKAAQSVLSSNHVEVFVEGHADSLGEGDIRRASDIAFAKDFSKKRADAVLSWLKKRLGKEAGKHRLVSYGMGATVPLVAGGLPKDQQANRRVVVRLVYSADNHPSEGYWYHGQRIPKQDVQFER